MTEDELAEIEARAEAATEGPWKTGLSARGDVTTFRRVHVVMGWQDGPATAPEDAAFIAAERADIPALVAEVRRLRGVADLVKAIDYHPDRRWSFRLPATPDTIPAIPVVKMYRDRLLSLHQSYAMLLGFASEILGKPPNEICPLNLIGPMLARRFAAEKDEDEAEG